MKVTIAFIIYHDQNTNHPKLNACYIHTSYVFENGMSFFKAQPCLGSNWHRLIIPLIQVYKDLIFNKK